ncbi:AMP-binding protein [Streptomyces sp. SID4982]|uniref:AMP-binding protein n=1 Tax=Streptomyces sp. SID4982 TaxID=2690291 RepID=UPI00136BC234|nr:AMP-binding protein [Streptomyces sp. SID4982]MYS16172.1 AMP-binding protein [Streptomyces sp. SID4982]
MFTPEPGFPLGDIPAAYAAERPGTVAVRCGDAELTWEELHRASDAVARGLKRTGVGHGHIVPLMLPNGVDVVVAAFACLRIGAVPQPLSTRLAPAEEEAILALSEPVTVVGLREGAPVGDGRFSSTTVAVLRRLGSAEAALKTEVGPSWKAPTSGGSTGRPKIILSGAAGAFNPFDMEAWGLRPGERSLVTAPVHHNAPFSTAMTTLFNGGTVTLLARFDAERVLAEAERHAITWVYLVPTMMRRILALPAPVRARYDLSSLVSVWHCAEPCPPATKQAWIDWLGPERVWELYAGTEAQAGCTISGTEWLEHRGSVGRPAWGEIRIVGLDGTPVTGPGVPGEIFMRVDAGKPPAFRYLGAELHETDGWSTLGDIGEFDADGYLYLHDRRSDMLLVGGVNVYPAEIEGALTEHPHVLSSAVIGLPDPDRGNRVHAIVQIEEGRTTTPEELTAFLAARLSPHKLPRSVELVTAPLRSAAGKLRRSALRAERLDRTFD